MNPNKNKDVYFASEMEPQDLAAGMQGKIIDYRKWCIERGLNTLWKKKLSNYYGISGAGNTSMAVTPGGAEGELSMIKVNDLHNLIQNQLVIVTGQRPAGIARAINSNSKSLKNARTATAVAEFYMSSKGWEQKFVNAALISLLIDEAYLELYWDRTEGEAVAVDPMTGKPEMSGDCTMNIHCPWNIARDVGAKTEKNNWNIVTFNINRFEAATKYPKFREQILQVGKADLCELGLDTIPDSSDEIKAHMLIHNRTSAIQSGRYSLMIGDEIVMDVELPYPKYPLLRMSAEDIIDGCMGYSPSNDILALEDVTDSLHSIATTNMVTFGGQCLVGPIGCDLNHSELAKGVRYFQLPPDQVNLLKPLDLLHTPPELFNYIGALGSKKEQQVGVNSIVRGQPEGALSGASGSAMALIQAQAISFNSGTQRSYFTLMSDTMTSLISILRVYADTPRVAKIAGKHRAANLREFRWVGGDLESVSSIEYEMTNAVSQTPGGRLTMAQDLLKIPGMIKSPKQYINVVQTGSLDVLTEDDEADGLLIIEENEWLNEGKPFKAIITQIHADHIKSHSSQITLEMTASEPEKVERILNHMQEHIDLWAQASQSNPGILMATGQQPLLIQGPAPMTGGQGGPPPLPEENSSPNPKLMNQLEGGGGNAEVIEKASQVNQPSLPTVAGTNEKAVVPGITQ